MSSWLAFLNSHLTLRTFLVGHSLTLADLAVWSALTEWLGFTGVQHKSADELPHLMRWYKLFTVLPAFRQAVDLQRANPATLMRKSAAPVATKDMGVKAGGGSFDVDLPGAKIGAVCTRFPPEPSGYLHIGHAKAAFLNNYFARLYEGKLIVRFDDTNPSKEKDEFVENILKDLRDMGIVPDVITHTSDSFGVIQEYCAQLLREGKAYVDDTPVEDLRAQRGDMIESKNRNNAPAANLALWEEMLKGTKRGQECCVRAKIDMQSTNGALRDPILYRVNLTPHHRTGTTYKAYPTYDFACPIVDSIEGVTHALRTTEYHDRNAQYEWIAKALGIRQAYIWDFSRLNFAYTLMSKRKLQMFVDRGLVGGWNDPRFPTIQGLLARGLKMEAIREFILEQGASKNIAMQEWEKLWVTNRNIIDPTSPRYAAVPEATKVLVVIEDGPRVVEGRTVLKYKKNPDLGTKVQQFFHEIYLDGADFADSTVGEEITLLDWGNCTIKALEKTESGAVSRVVVTNPNGEFKGTKKKLQWVANTPDATTAICVELGYLITKPKYGEEDDFESLINRDSWHESRYLASANLRTHQKGDIFQFERVGYFIVHRPYISAAKPAILFLIPDGKKIVVPPPAASASAATSAPAPAAAPTKAKAAAPASKPQKGAAAPAPASAPAAAPTPAAAPAAAGDIADRVQKQGELVRTLKANKASKPEIDAAVAELLKLKQEAAAAGAAPAPAPAAPAPAPAPVAAAPAPAAAAAGDIADRVQKQGELVRTLKANKAPKPEIDAAVAELLKLKQEAAAAGVTLPAAKK
eukprot:TRINITY_DN604_c1_g1_i2.p1 TRINITY_DN604_c1_g1~~TRINITY_DN604_c1_g1_i2.p1  ORF type:complete len:805 (+),score=242.55 TRINITY_DN604_c1_g1_i2:308-2722(+)